jgi:hypothetical protein
VGRSGSEPRGDEYDTGPVRKIDVSKARIPGTDLRGWPAVGIGALGLYILLFIILNDRKLEVDFVAFSVKSNELLALLVILALGFAAGFVVRGRLRPTTQPGAEQRALDPPAADRGAVAPADHEKGRAE